MPSDRSHSNDASGANDDRNPDSASSDDAAAGDDAASGGRAADEVDLNVPGGDPRLTITPEVFEVNPDLLGLPLAPPWRRLVAIIIDFAVAGLLVNVGGAWLGLAVAFLFFRIATRRQVQNPLKRWARATLAFIGAFFVFITAIAVIDGGDDEDGAPVNVAALFTDGDPVPDASAPPDTSDGAPETVADSVAALLQQHGLDYDDIGTSDLGLRLEALATRTHPLDSMDGPARAEAATLLRSYAAAVAAQDTAAVDSLQPAVAALTAGARLDELRRELNEAEREARTLRERNEQLETLVEEPSFLRIIQAGANDLGLTFGWIAVYFTLFWAWWDGQTPGKRLLGCKVVRLDGKPISLWFALERFGGYAAGVVTGFLGFAQMYWDPNRQGIHDRIARTVVVHTSGERRTS